MVVILTFLLAVGMDYARAQPGFWDANRLIDDGWVELRNGEYFESVSDPSSARQAYENASNAAGQSLVIADQMGVPFDQRPASPYFLFGQAELHRAQLLYGLGSPWGDVDYSLNRARQAFDDVPRLVDGRFAPGSPDWVGMRSEALFSLGSVYFLLGDLGTADQIMREVEMLRPTFAPAREVQSAIDYTAGGQTSQQTPSGTVLPERPQEGLGGERLKAYAIEIGKALFGRWGTIAGMLVEDVFKTSP